MRAFLKRNTFWLSLALLYLYSFPYFAKVHSANELPRVYLTQAMVEEGSFAIDTGVERWGTTVDVSPSAGHCVSNKAPGSSFLAVPAYVVLKGIKMVTGGEPTLAEMTWTFRFATGIVPTLLFMMLLWRFLERWAPKPETRRLLIAGYGLGSMALTYSILFISHQLAAVCIGTSFILIVWVVRGRIPERWLLAAGLAAGCAPLVDYQAAFAGVPIAAYLLWHMLSRRRWRGVLLAVAGAVPPIALLLFYHWQAFGGPFKTGYDLSVTFAHFHQQGFLGMTRLRWDAFAGSTVAPDNGLVFLCPMLLLALPGWYLLARKKQWWMLSVTASIALIYLLFISSINFWRGGWQLGPRYITAMIPFLMVPVAVAVAEAERWWPARATAVGLVLVGIVVYAVSAAEFPHFPEKFHNPLYELTFRLVREGHAPYNAGWLVGLRGLASLVPYFLGLGALSLWIAVPGRRQLRSGIAGIGLAIAVLAAYSIPAGGGPRAEGAYKWIVSGEAGTHRRTCR